MKLRQLALVFAGIGVLVIAGCDGATAKGPEGKSLTLDAPKTIEISRGTTRTVQIGVERDDVNEPVTVSMSLLPHGVSARQTSRTVASTENSVAFIIEASNDAALVRNQVVAVTIEGPDGMRGTEYVRLNVVE